VDSIHLEIATLEECYDSYDKSFINLLISKANSFGLNEIVAVYLQPLMYTRKFASGTNATRYEDYSPLTSKTWGAFDVEMETLSYNIYTIRSFFGAVHAILYHCLPPNRTSREYIEIFTHFTRLLNRALRPYFELVEQMQLFRPKISLLVSLSPVHSRYSRAIIGFSAVGQ